MLGWFSMYELLLNINKYPFNYRSCLIVELTKSLIDTVKVLYDYHM